MPGLSSSTVRASGSSRIASEPTRARALARSSGSGSFRSRRARRQSRTTGATVTSNAPPDRSYIRRESSSTRKRSAPTGTGGPAGLLGRAASARSRACSRSAWRRARRPASKAAREARLAVASSAQYKTIWNALPMCVSSNSNRDRPGPGSAPSTDTGMRQRTCQPDRRPSRTSDHRARLLAGPPTRIRSPATLLENTIRATASRSVDRTPICPDVDGRAGEPGGRSPVRGADHPRGGPPGGDEGLRRDDPGDRPEVRDGPDPRRHVHRWAAPPTRPNRARRRRAAAPGRRSPRSGWASTR